MDIKTIEIKNIYTNQLKSNCEGVEHIKTLPFLSVVQALHGDYEIGLDGSLLEHTGEGGAFIAPPKSLQRIVHHNGEKDFMEAQWIFMEVTVNGLYGLEDLFVFPTILPPEYNAVIFRCISVIRGPADICEKYSAAYQILGCLLESALRSKEPDEGMMRLKSYVMSNYHQRLTDEDLARQAYCSTSHLYRIFRKYFSSTPSNYINAVRLQNAALLLENSEISVAEIADRVGFDDVSYFSKLFKRRFHVSPRLYRQQNMYKNS